MYLSPLFGTLIAVRSPARGAGGGRVGIGGPSAAVRRDLQPNRCNDAKQIAIVAMARRMLEDAWTMLKDDEVFRLMTVTSNVTDVRAGDPSTQLEIAADPSDVG